MTGYRVLPHAADVIVEAWAPTRLGCFAAAVRGLVSVFADRIDASADGRHEFSVDGATDEELLVSVLEEAIYIVDVRAAVPVAASLVDTPTGLRGTFATVPVGAVEVTGAVPKGVSRSGATFVCDEGARCRCQVIVDV